MVEKPNKLQAALLGGIVFGVLSAIPFVNLANICCCLWIAIGGAVAARTLINRSPFPVTSGDGAGVGALAGAISSGVYLVLGIPLALLTNEIVLTAIQNFMSGVQDPNVRKGIEDAVTQARNQSVAEQLGGSLLQWLIVSAVGVGFATLGGVIGVALFEKRKGQPMAPPPQPPYGGGVPPQY